MLENIKGNLRIFRNEGKGGHVFYKTNIASSKNEKGEYTNFYCDVKFAKSLKLPEGESFEVSLKESWLTANKGSDGKVYLALFINQFKAL